MNLNHYNCINLELISGLSRTKLGKLLISTKIYSDIFSLHFDLTCKHVQILKSLLQYRSNVCKVKVYAMKVCERQPVDSLDFNLFINRMFHIDDVPSGAGEGIKDINKALAVCTNFT